MVVDTRYPKTGRRDRSLIMGRVGYNNFRGGVKVNYYKKKSGGCQKEISHAEGGPQQVLK